MCKNWREKGNCKYGDKCLFAHGEAELTKRTTAPEAGREKAEQATVEKEMKSQSGEDSNELEQQNSSSTPSFKHET